MSQLCRDLAPQHLQLLGNGRYAVMLTAAGSGRSRWRDIAVTRWREDPVRDAWGSYLLLRDEDSGQVWSPAVQPYAELPADYAIEFSDGLARITRRDGSLQSVLEVAVAGDHDAELRRVSIHNHGGAPRLLSLTTYAELVLAPASADDAHAAFSKLFVTTEWEADRQVLLATRRHQASDEPPVWAAHFVVFDPAQRGQAIEFETDRAQFLGRGRLLREAQAMKPGAHLGGHVGCVIDPVFSLRQSVEVAAGCRAQITFCTAVGGSRDAVLDAVEALRTVGVDALLAAAATRARRQRHRVGMDPQEAATSRRWAGALLYANRRMRASDAPLQRGHGGAPVLWSKGISGDRPISVLRVTERSQLPRFHALLSAQRHWQQLGLASDLVILQDAADETAAIPQATLQALLQTQRELLKNGNDCNKCEVFALRAGDVDDAFRDGLLSAARLVLDAGDDAFDTTEPSATAGSANVASGPALKLLTANLLGPPSPTVAPPTLEMPNGIGGFVDDGRAYAIELTGEDCTPLPWVNIIANPALGFMVSAEGGGYSWSINSQQNTLTPWPNDPVSDSPHDVIYLRDCESGETWSATALPMRVTDATYSIEHRRGSSRFQSVAHGIESELLQWVPVRDAVKLSRLRLHNRSGRDRVLSVTAYVQWALGANGQVSAPHVLTWRDAATGAVFACNRWRADFAERVAFFDLGGQQLSGSGDRAAFLGLHGDVGRPRALADDAPLPGRFGAGLDPCGALQTRFELRAGESIELRIMLGDAESAEAARLLVETHRHADLDALLGAVHEQWDGVLGDLQVRTPERGMDIMLNGWLLYQALACRVWARAAYYQASGAYGFRDQLQDVMALCLSRPDIAREHLLRAGGRQFAPGDVQHWWLPPSGQGIRTHISDDRVWLSYVAAHYLDVTADLAVLDESLSFLQGPAIEPGKNDAFFQPQQGGDNATLFEHCARAIDSAMTEGAHGLPLIGTGDWNDGLNRVGVEGRGESTWLGWFLIATINAFAPYAEGRGERARATRWRNYAMQLATTLDGDAGWDGRWYRRGYYDDGTVLGSAQSEEGRIDCIAQSWSVMSGAADRARSAQAMASADEMLVRHDDKLALLFTPPFDRTPLDPGYIKGYPPGIRENGGQYTHGAIWSIFAWAALGEGDRAAALFALLNPTTHADSAGAIERYKVEPYVSCADVYSIQPHVGRGGWTWYSGSAGWLYRAGIEAILGLYKRGDSLRVDPCIPASWPGFELRFRHRDAENHVSTYLIEVSNPGRVHRGVVQAELDGKALPPAADGAQVPLLHDRRDHHVRIVLGTA